MNIAEYENDLKSALVDIERAKHLMMEALFNISPGVADKARRDQFRHEHYDLVEAAGFLNFASESLVRAAKFAGRVQAGL